MKGKEGREGVRKEEWKGIRMDGKKKGREEERKNGKKLG